MSDLWTGGPLPPLDDLEMVKMATGELHAARRTGAVQVTVPIWLLEALIEKATRPHD